MVTKAEQTLLDKTRALLASTEKTYLAIYDATGLKPNWLSLVASGKITDPSVNKIEQLYKFLAQTESAQ